MKKYLLIVLITFLTLSNVFAQTAANALWTLYADSTSVVTGNVVATGQTKTADLKVKDYGGGAMTLNIGERLYCNPWPGSELAPNFNRWVQFQVSPKAGYNFTITKISYIKAGYGTHGHMHANAWYDVQPDFSTKIEIDTTGQVAGSDLPFGIPDARDRDCPVTEINLNVLVKDGNSFYLRAFPWYSVTSTSNSKYFLMKDVKIEGTTSPAVGVEKENGLPSSYSLEQNYPNPFNPSTKISFSLPKDGYTRLVVYNLLGKEVAQLVNRNLNAGNYSFSFNAQNLPSGLYLYSLISGNFSVTKKMLLMK